MLARRKRKDSNSSSLVSEPPEEQSPARGAMDALRHGLSDSLSGLTHKGHKAEDRPAVSVTEVQNVSDDEAKLNGKAVVKKSSTASVNGSTNGAVTTVTTNGSSETSFSHFSRVKDVFRSVTNLISRNADYTEATVKETDLRAYLHFISDERLIHMPRRGSDWDRVLSYAQFFGLQVWLFGKKIDSYIPGGKDSAAAALASCKMLLQAGHAQAPALLPTFVALYELAMLLSTVGQLNGLESMSSSIKESAAHIFCDLVSLTGNIAVHYRRKIAGLKAGLSVAIDFDHSFGEQISHIWQAKQALYDQIWAHKLGRKRFSISVQSVREELQSSGEVSIRSTLYDEVADSLERSEDTCHWVKHQLTQFLQSSEQVLSITGPAGSGKSMLAEWVQERLSRPLDHQNYITLNYDFAFDSPTDSTAIACVKSLLSQLLERSVGDISLYEQLVIAFEDFSGHHDTEKLEASLWNALRSGLQVVQRDGTPVVIITDGCDSIIGGEKNALQFHSALRRSVSKLSGVRVVTFSRPVSHLSDGCKHVVITHQELQEDIRAHLGQALSKSTYFSKLDASARDQLIEELTAKAKGNFLWAFYAGRLLQSASQESYAGLKQSIGADIPHILQQVVSEKRLQNDETLRLILSFMLVTTRPLTIDEFTHLLAINTTKRISEKQTVDILKYVPEKCGDIVIIRGGRLHFRSSTVRSYLSTQMGKTLLSSKDAHLQLLLRSLLYARLHLQVDREPLLGNLENNVAEELVSSRQLLLYVVEYWTLHLKESGLISAGGEFTLPDGFAEIFPDTVTFALLERTYWTRSYSSEIIISYHELGLKVRKATFGEKHITVLQSLITLSHAHRHISTTSNHSASYLVQAIRLGISLFSETSVIVGACVSLFLLWTETIVITERTEIITYREEVIKIMIKICKHKYGHSSNEVVRWYEKLAKLYVAINEKHQATIVYRELYEIIIVRDGKKSEKAKEIGSAFGSLGVILKGDDAEKDIGGLEILIFETNEDLEVSDKMSITMTIRLAQSYVASGKLFLAERLYINLWRRITALCTADARVEIHIAKIQIALEYVKFLHKYKRSEEATNILICLWAEYEHYSSQVESLTIWIREIGISCKSFGLLSIAASILTKVWGWFKSKGKVDDEEAQKTTVLITEVVEEITETTITKKTTKITTTEVTETAVREIFETHFVRCQKTKADRAFFSSCMALIGVYMQGSRWTEAEAVLKRTLSLTWAAVLSAELKITLSAHSITETIEVARRLAICYQQQGLLEQAESIYLRIYNACLISTTIEEVSFSQSVAVLIEFYEQHHRHEKVIEVYVAVLEKYRKQYGHNHGLTIKTLYLLAAQCELLGRVDAYKYYLEIVTVLNKGIKHCHHDAIKAALALTKHYHSRKMWVELRSICEVVWQTVISHREQIKLEIEIITEVYKKYVYVLEVHAKVEFSVLYKITAQYKDVAIAVSGALSSVALLAWIELAHICEKQESHYHESVTIYEEVLKKIKTTKTTETIITEITIHTVKKRLSKLYVTVITTGKSGTTDKPTIDRAIEITLESYLQLKAEFGCWHETTLLKLKEVVLLYHKSATQESHTRIVQLLQTSVTEIITTLTVTASLFSVAKTVASIYISVGLVAKGQELLHQLRHWVIFREGWKTSEVTLKLDAKVTKAVFSFLIAFELGLSGKSGHYSELMVDIILESVLYEEYSRVIEKETKLEVILECGAKLRGFWEERKRVELLAILDKKLLQLFMTEYAASFKSVGEQGVHIFYLAILVELGKEQRATKINFNALACKAGIHKVKTLIQAGDLANALLVGRCLFHFASTLQLYRDVHFIQYGYKLAELLAGTEIPLPTGAKYETVKKSMLDTSKEVMVEVLASSHAAKIDFARLRFEDLAGLIRLLGAQGNYSELVLLLSRVWICREELQKLHGWSPTMVLRIGTLLIHAQQSNRDNAGAVATAELLYYNVRRGRGRLDPETLSLSRLLSSLYVANGRNAKAIGVHESVLKEIASACQEHESNRRDLAVETKLQLDCLKSAQLHSKSKGRPAGEIHALFDRVKTTTKLELPGFEQWIENTKGTQNVNYITNTEWKFVKI
ncbi:hypothetical protein HJFPF1_05935 [Paramyrothecium foliicola]|nr:hypothetical protein HJFPF1_05935 [Paramyrothecium foliicola]